MSPIFSFRKKPTRGQRGEDIAAAYLHRRGYKILHKNLRLDRFELDIVARKKDTIVFVEVRSRTSSEISAPEETIGFTKRQHLRAAARRYMTKYGEPDINYRFDVIGVLLSEGAEPKISHIKFAFRMEEL